MPWCDTDAMAAHLIEISAAVDPGAHAVLIVDQAGWHLTPKLAIPDNITVLALPPRSPELNPVENVWQFMRDNWLSNRIFKSYEDIVALCCQAWNNLIDQPWKIMSLGGVRESAQSWRELLLDLKRRGLAVAPELAIADGALGFWKAIEEVCPRTRSQRCWVHKTANVLNKLPKSRHSKAKRALQDIWMVETRNHADSAFDAFIETYAVKYDKAAACLVKDRETMLAFYDFPAEHWKHLRTTNPIESTFATVRHRTVRSKGCLSNKTALAMVFKLAQAAQNSWRRLDGHNLLPKLIVGVKFIDGIEAVRQKPQAAA